MAKAVPGLNDVVRETGRTLIDEMLKAPSRRSV